MRDHQAEYEEGAEETLLGSATLREGGRNSQDLGGITTFEKIQESRMSYL